MGSQKLKSNIIYVLKIMKSAFGLLNLDTQLLFAVYYSVHFSFCVLPIFFLNINFISVLCTFIKKKCFFED